MQQPHFVNCTFHFYGDGNALLSNGVGIAIPGVEDIAANAQITAEHRGYWLIVDSTAGDVLLQLPSLLDAQHDRMPLHIKHEIGEGVVGVLAATGDTISGKMATQIAPGGWRQLIAHCGQRRWIEICGGCEAIPENAGATRGMVVGGAKKAKATGGKRAGTVRGGAKPGKVVGGESS